MDKKLPHNVYIDNLINPDGSRVEGSGKPLSQRMRIDPSKTLQKQPIASPWAKSAMSTKPKLGFSSAEVGMGNIPLDYSANPAQEIANLNFNDPLLMEMMKGNSPQPAVQQAAQSVMAQGSASPEHVSPSMGEQLLPGSNRSSMSMSSRMPMGNRPIMASSEGGLGGMIQDFSQKGQAMASNRDDELLRLINMRDNAEGSLAGRSTFGRMDLGPLNAFIDSQFGTKYAQSYKAPDSGVDDMNVMNALNDRVSGYTKNKNAEQLALYKTIMDAQNKDESLEQKLLIAQMMGSGKRDSMADWTFKEEYKRNNAQLKQPNADQSKAATYATRMEQAVTDIGGAAKSFDRTGLLNSIKAKLAPEAYRSEGQKLTDQGERNYVNALLRRESGAAISPTEFSTAESQYFDRVNDTQEVKRQKARNREIAIAGMKAEAGDVALGRVQERLGTPTNQGFKPSGGMSVDNDAVKAALAKRGIK